MKKTFLFCFIIMSINWMPRTAHAQSFWKQLGKAITDIANMPSTGNQQSTSSPRVYNVQPTRTQSNTRQTTVQQPSGPLYQIHTTSNTKTITLQGGVQYLGNFSCGIALVKWKKGWFAINQNGDKVFDLPTGYWPGDKYKNTYYEFSNNRLIICTEAQNALNNNIAIIDTQGSVIKEFKNVTGFSSIQNGVAIIKDEKYDYCYIDQDGNVLSRTLPVHEALTVGPVLGYMREGMRRFYDEKTKRYGYCDEKCNIVLSAQFKGADNFFNGLAKVKNNDDLWGYIDKTGRFVIEPKYSIEPGSFYNDYAWVKDKAGKIYFIDRTGEFVWQEPATGAPQRLYNFLSDLDNGGYALWVYDRSLYIVDSSFRKRAKLSEVFETSGNVTSYDDDWFQFTDDDMRNFVYDWNGRLLLKFDGDYGRSSVFHNGLCRMDDNGGDAHFYFNLKGEVVIQFKDTQF